MAVSQCPPAAGEPLPSTPNHTSPHLIPVPALFIGPHNWTERWFCCRTAYCEAGNTSAMWQMVGSAAWLDSIWRLKLLPVITYHFAIPVWLLLKAALLRVTDGDSPQTTSIWPCSSYTNLHSAPLTVSCLGPFTFPVSQSLTALTIYIQEFTCFGITLGHFNPWKWDHYIILTPINQLHLRKNRPQTGSYLNWLPIM